MAVIVGDGRISGWNITELTFPNIRVSKGNGFINKRFVETLDDQDFELATNTTVNVFAQHRTGVIGTEGPRSDVVEMLYQDVGAPAMPAGFSASAPSSQYNQYFSVLLTWTANTEIDLDHYLLERSISGQNEYESVDTIDSSETSYVDEDIDEDTSYDYRLFAVDQSGYTSPAASLTHTTSLSPDLPPNPLEVFMPHSEQAINILWKRPETLTLEKINYWNVTWTKLRPDGTEISSSTRTTTVHKDKLNYRIRNLENGDIYKVTIQTVDNKNRASVGFTQNVIPRFSTAPKDPEGIAVTETELVQKSVILSMEWTDGADEYDPLIPYRYNIYITIDGQQESLPINVPIGQNDEQIELYTFDLATYFSIPQDTLITLRLTSVSQNGIESFGNYERFITSDFSTPLPVSNLSSEFDQDTGKITVTWNNQTDTAYLVITVFDDYISGDYPSTTIINENIGLVNTYTFDASENHIYTITVTTYNINDIAGTPDVTVETTQIAGGIPRPFIPNDIFPKTGDRQVSFSWGPSPSISTASYNIYRRLGPISVSADNWELIDNVPGTNREFSDFGLTNDVTYSYYITSVDIYGQESLHLPDGAFNLNFFQLIPKSSGSLSYPTNVVANLSGNDVYISWTSVLEEFDSFIIYRSIGNLHSWEKIATVNRDDSTYIDTDIDLIDGTIHYYTVGKIINDSDIVVQISDEPPDSSILIGVVTVSASTMSIDVSERRDILNLVDPIGEYTNSYLLDHVHKEIDRFDPERIDLNPELVVTNWETVDGRIFTSNVIDISGSSHILKIDGKFPKVLFSIDQVGGRIIFTEPIVTINDDGNVVGELPDIELQIFGVEEVQGVLPDNRFNDIHARQVGFGRLNIEQMPSLNHEGRLRESVLPKSYLLERFGNQTFIVPQGNTDEKKTFGDGIAFYSVIESDGLIEDIVDWDTEDDDAIVGFNQPSNSSDTVANLADVSIDYVTNDLSKDIAQEQYFDGKFFAFSRYGIPNGSRLYTVNKDTLAVSNIGSNDLLSMEDTFIDPVDNRYYALTPGGWSDIAPALFWFDLVTGRIIAKREIVPYSSQDSLSSITSCALNPNTHTLYMISLENVLVSTDMYSLVATRVHPTNTVVANTFIFGLAFDAVNNVLYGTSSFSSNSGKLWTINTTTGVATEVGDIDASDTQIVGLTYDYEDQMLYGIQYDGTGSYLWSINPTTGAGTNLGLFTAPNNQPAEGVVAPPEDSFYYPISNLDESDQSVLYMGNSPGLANIAYLRFRIDLDSTASISRAVLQFQSHFSISSSGTASFTISVLDPSQYVDSVSLATEAMKTVETIGSMTWNPGSWSLSEDSDDTAADVSNLLRLFLTQDSYTPGRHIIFKIMPSGSASFIRAANPIVVLETGHVKDVAKVTSDIAFQSEKSYYFRFEFTDTSPTRWVRINTFNAPILPNPVVDLKKRIKMKIMFHTVDTSGSIYMALGIRKITSESVNVGENGGIIGPIEWLGVESVLLDDDENPVPIGKLVNHTENFIEIEFDPESDSVYPFSDTANGLLDTKFGVLEHIAFTINPDAPGAAGPFEIFIDRLEQVDDVLVAGTSQGIQISRDFGASWKLNRLVNTPVHKFYRAVNNPFIWALAGNSVLIAVDASSWFETSGLTGVQYVRDIVEDDFGNMYVSTDQGVYWFEIALISKISSWRQTQPIAAFTTDCYGLYHNSVSSGIDEIWVSTDIGIYKTTDSGRTWVETGMLTEGLPVYQFINISAGLPNFDTNNTQSFSDFVTESTDNASYAFYSDGTPFSLWAIPSVIFLIGHQTAGAEINRDGYLLFEVNIPKYSTVRTSSIEFTPFTLDPFAVESELGITVINPSGLSNEINLSEANSTAILAQGILRDLEIVWTPDGSGGDDWTVNVVNDASTTPDISPLVQAFIDRAEYEPGQKMIVKIRDRKPPGSPQSWISVKWHAQGNVTRLKGTYAPPILNVLACTKKHILRKIGRETDFSVFANFEIQHNVVDIWNMSYFAGHLYVSTGSGVFWNTTDEFFIPDITTVFEKIFPGLNTNGQNNIAFGMDVVDIGDENQLFISQENRLMVSDQNNKLSIKEQFNNRESPSFYVDDELIKIGYIYNSFNNVLIFREPQPVDKVYKASYLPRKIYEPVNGGWAQTNPSADVFVYVNGVPKWIDFKLDTQSILGELQILQGKLSPIQGTLTDFNSLHPQASNLLTTVLSDINTMKTGGTNQSSLVNNATIIKFLEDYTRFLSLITKNVITNNDLDIFPKFNIVGFPASQRAENSRASILEEKEDFTASDSTGIIIDTYSGEIDFLTVFTSTTDLEEKQNFVFDKNDYLQISVFNSNISNTGSNTHRELEDKMEMVNTGLTSHLSRAYYTNLIKTGIFFETQHPYLFETTNASNVQSKFNAAHNNDWYDITNSTIDYTEIVNVANEPESKFANTLDIFSNQYLMNKVWVGTDSDILQFNLDTSDGTLTLDDKIRPGNGSNPLFIWDVFVHNSTGDIFVVAEEKDHKVGHIYQSSDYGVSWEDLDTLNLPQQIYQFSILNGNRIVGTESGIFYSDNSFGTWYPGILTLSPLLNSNSPSVASFNKRIRNINSSTFHIAESEKWFYISSSGIDWYALSNQMNSNNTAVINKIVRFKNLTWIATDRGLYNDGNSILSDSISFGLQTGLEDSAVNSSNVNVGDIAYGTDYIYCSSGNSIYRLHSGVWTKYEIEDLPSIHKILLTETADNHYMIVISHNIIKSIDVTPGSGVFN